MENNKEVRRICKNCGIIFTLTKLQMRQVKTKWPVNCSRSCGKILQHKNNYGDKRENKKCEVCNKIFIIVNWNRDKKYCSLKCAGTGRFKKDNSEKVKKRLKQILKDNRYLKYIKGIALRIAFKYNRDKNFADEIVQDFFLALCEGNNTTIENVAKSYLRKELKRGIVGKWDVDFCFSTEDSLKYMKESYKFLSSYEFIEYIYDVFRGLNEFERKFILLYLKGFTDYEVMSEIRKKFPIGNKKFYEEKKRLLEKYYSNYGNNYKKFKLYK